MLPFLETNFQPNILFTAFSNEAHENGLGSINDMDWKQYALGLKGSQLSNFTNIFNIHFDHFKKNQKRFSLLFFLLELHLLNNLLLDH